jgi:hypothetical protein
MTQDEQDEIEHDQITKQVSASRHTPEWITWKPDGLDAVSFGESKQLPVGKVFAGPRAAQIAKRIVDNHNALAGMNPEAVKDVVSALETCITEGAPDSNRERAEVAHQFARAALAALKGSK